LKNLPFPESSTGIATDQPVEAAFKIPSNIYIGDDITALKVCVWDAEKQRWSNEYIQPAKEEAKKDRQILFTTQKLAPMAML